MTRQLLGRDVARALLADAASRSARLRERGCVPTLCTVRRGEAGDDVAYERGIASRCEAAGVELRRVALSGDCPLDELVGAVRAAAEDPGVHGVLVFRPLPAGWERACAQVLPAEKDVDCMTDACTLSALSGDGAGFSPCTPEAVLALLDHYGVPLAGARACVVGRSAVVGRPLALMLCDRDATVTLCHSRTRDLAAACREADVVVCAAGRAGLVGEGCLRDGQVVVDVGTNWDASAGRLVGDVDPAAAQGHDLRITPVPGGVGAVTTAVLATHAVQAAERSATHG